MKKMFLLVVCLIAGAAQARGTAGEEKALDIVTTLFPQYDFARIMGGDRVRVKLLLPPGADPHAFDPRPSDMRAIADADIFAYTGADMEPWAEKVIGALKDSGSARAIDLSAGMQLLRSSELNEEELAEQAAHDDHDHDAEDDHDDHDDHGHDAEEDHADHDHDAEDDHAHAEDGHDHGAHDAHAGHVHILDPHIWLDPVLAMQMADTLLAAMCEADPANAAYYTANAAGLKNDLRALDTESMQMVAAAKRRVLVFGGRFAFAYFTKRYGLEHVGAYDSCGAGAEPSVRRVLEVTEYVMKNKIPVIYHEEGVDPRISAGIAGVTGCRTMEAHSLHNLSDAELAAGVRFTEVMRRNIAAFAEGLE